MIVAAMYFRRKRVEAYARRQDGSEFPVELALTRVETALPSFLGFIRDISERRQAEAMARENEAVFTRLFVSGIMGILILDFSGNISVANDAFLAMIDRSRAELNAGKVHSALLTPPERRASTALALEHLKQTGVSAVYETEYFRKDGQRVPVRVGSVLLAQTSCLSFVVDLTDKKRAEEEHSRLAAQAKKEQVGRQLAEEALRQSEQQLRHAQKMDAVGRLAGGVAHDFNNVLSVILSYSELILGDLPPGESLWKDVEEIRKAAKRAAGLTRQLLLFSRQQASEPRVLNLNEALFGMEAMLQRIVGEDIELQTVMSPDIGRICIDPIHVEQVIMNLVVNARDAMPTGGTINIETAEISLQENYAQSHTPAEPGQYVMLIVRDTGSGMDKEIQTRIFEPFFTTKEKGKGTGLGLSTVFGIVRQNGGGIWVESEPEKGACFKVYFPRVDRAVDLVRSITAPTTLRGSETILLVEDEDQVRAVALSALQRQGYEVISAHDGNEALHICERHPGLIHLLLTDVVMPQMSGPELAKRAVSLRPKMKVLCMSGYIDETVVRHGLYETGIAFLQKPIAPAMLARRIREILDAPSG